LAYLEQRSTEIKSLLVAARAADADRERNWVEFAQHPQFDWDSLLNEAGRHGLKPLLCRFLESVASITMPPNVPAAVLAELQQARQATLLRNLRLSGELWELLKLFSNHSIIALPFKGPTLAALS
jgi:hypothetical protein